MGDSYQQLINDGAGISNIVLAWASQNKDKDEYEWMKSLNHILRECVRTDNVELAKTMCNLSSFHQIMQRYEHLYNIDNKLGDDDDDDDEYGVDEEINNCNDDEERAVLIDCRKVRREFKLLQQQGSPLDVAIQARHAPITRILLTKGYEAYYEFQDVDTDDIAKFLLPGEVHTLLQNCADSGEILETLASIDVFNFDESTFVFEVDKRDQMKKWQQEQMNCILSQCVLGNKVELAQGICQHTRFTESPRCNFEKISPLVLAFEQDNNAMIGILLRAGYHPPTSSTYPVIKVTGEYYMCDHVKSLVKRNAPHMEIMEAWTEKHANDDKGAQMEQLNWLLIQSQTYAMSIDAEEDKSEEAAGTEGNSSETLSEIKACSEKDNSLATLDKAEQVAESGRNGMEFAKAICCHPLFPKEPTHRFINNSPLFEAVKRKNHSFIEMLLHSGYDPTDFYIDSKKMEYELLHFNAPHDYTHPWQTKGQSGRCSNLLEELLLENNLDIVKLMAVQLDATMKNKTSLLHTACYFSHPGTIESLLSLGIFTRAELNEEPFWPGTEFPILRLSTRDDWLIRSTKVLMKYGADPFVGAKSLVREPRTLLAKICAWLRTRDHRDDHLNIDWVEAFALIEYLLDGGNDVSFGMTIPEHPVTRPLESFAAINPAHDLPQKKYDAILNRLAQSSNGKTKNSVFTSLLRAMCFSISCDEEPELEFPELTFDMEELCTAGDEPDVKHIQSLRNRAKILVEHGAVWDTNVTVPFAQTMFAQHEQFDVEWIERDDAALNSRNMCLSYLLELFPFALPHLEDVTEEFIGLLIEDLKIYGPFFHIYLDLMTNKKRKKTLRNMRTLANAVINVEKDVKLALLSWLQNIQTVRSLKETTRGVMARELIRMKRFHMVDQLEMPKELKEFVLYRK